MAKSSKNDVRVRIHTRIAAETASGSQERPRLAVFRSLKHIYAQVIDDRAGTHAGGRVVGRKEFQRATAAAIWPAPRKSAS